MTSEIYAPTKEDEGDKEVVQKGFQKLGRWTEEERHAFLVGMAKYGRHWSKVAAEVGTRTVQQVRTHAQKHFKKIAKEDSQAMALRKKSISKAKIAMKGSEPLKKRQVRIQHLQMEISKHPAAAARRPLYPAPIGARPTPKTTIASAPVVVRSQPPVPVVAAAAAATAAPTTAARMTTVQLLLPFGNQDVFLPNNAATAHRPANQEYCALLKMNCFLFHSLPYQEQLSFCQNFCHFLTAVRGRRLLACDTSGSSLGSSTTYGSGMRAAAEGAQYHLIRDPAAVVQNEFRMDTVKVAALQAHPFWLLGDYNSSSSDGAAAASSAAATTTASTPFVYRDIFGNWKRMHTKDEVRRILRNEGSPRSLLLLPASMLVNQALSSKVGSSSSGAHGS